MKVFIIESCNPLDLMNGRSEKDSLEKICKMMGHDVTSFFAKSEQEFKTIFEYLSSINDYPDDLEEPICIHISCHGNESGLSIGNDFLTWSKVVDSLEPVLSMEDFGEPMFLAISACGTDKQQITSYINNIYRNSSIIPPNYIFFINQETVTWKDALLNWTILYHQIEELDIYNKKDFQDLLSKMADSGLGKLKYYRWDSRLYKYKYFKK